MVATDAVAVGTPKEGAPVKAKVGGIVVTDAAGGGGVPATAAAPGQGRDDGGRGRLGPGEGQGCGSRLSNGG